MANVRNRARMTPEDLSRLEKVAERGAHTYPGESVSLIQGAGGNAVVPADTHCLPGEIKTIDQPAAWASGTVYGSGSLVRNAADDNNYRCRLGHTAAAASEPDVGGSWTDYWVEVLSTYECYVYDPKRGTAAGIYPIDSIWPVFIDDSVCGDLDPGYRGLLSFSYTGDWFMIPFATAADPVGVVGGFGPWCPSVSWWCYEADADIVEWFEAVPVASALTGAAYGFESRYNGILRGLSVVWINKNCSPSNANIRFSVVKVVGGGPQPVLAGAPITEWLSVIGDQGINSAVEGEGTAVVTKGDKFILTYNTDQDNCHVEGYAVVTFDIVLQDVTPGSAIYPKRATMWHEDATVLVGAVLTHTVPTSAGQRYNTFSSCAVGANGDSWSHGCLLEAGTYTMKMLGIKVTWAAKIDVTVGGVAVFTGLDWYAAAVAYNTKRVSAAFVLPTSGWQTVVITVNGRHASATGWRIPLTYYHIKQAAD